jgi:peptide/nickel transport system substrate-binding protein
MGVMHCRTVARHASRKQLRRLARPLALGGLLVAAAVVAGCGGTGSGSHVAASADTSVVKVVAHRGGQVTMARAVQPSTLDPSLGQSDAGTIQSQIQVYDQLTEILPGHQDISPGLAKSWTISPDGLTYTFQLRAARFSDGSPVTSQDVVFTFGRLLDPKVDSGFAPFFSSFIASWHAEGPSTVVFKLKKRTPAFLAFLSFNVPSIVPKAYFQRVGARQFALHPVGSGAFKVVSFKPGTSLVLERNPYYWRQGLPYLDRVTMNFLPDDNARVLAYRSGSAQIADDIPFSQLASVRALPSTSLLVKQISAIDFIVMNEKAKPQLRSKNVRLALNYAVPRDAIKRTVFANAAPVANSMIPAIKYWDPNVPTIPYDMAKAKSLMAHSPTPHGGFALQYVYVAGDSAARAVGTILQDSWAKLGVTVKLKPEDFSTLYTNFGNGNFDLQAFQPTASSSDVPIDDELAISFLGPTYNSFFSYYQNPQLFKLIEDATTNPSETRRHQLFSQIQRMAMADPPFVPLVFSPARAAVNTSLHGFDYVKTNWFRMDQVSVVPGK